MGARHFAERAQRVQNLQQLWALKMGDPSVAAHMSGKEFAKIMAEELGEKSLYSENVAVFESMQTQKVAQEATLLAQEEEVIAAEQGI